MAVTNPGKVGRVRRRLALMLEAALPDYAFDPVELEAQKPAYLGDGSGCCVWYGTGRRRGGGGLLHVTSWDTMGECVLRGILITDYAAHTKEIHAKEPGR